MAGDSDSEILSEELAINIEVYRKLVQNYLNLNLYTSALFWAEKVVAMTNDDPNDVYALAQCMFLLKQYHRAVHIIKYKGLDKSHVLCHYLAVKSLFEAGSINEAMELVESVDLSQCLNEKSDIYQPLSPNMTFSESPKNQVEAVLCLTKGKIYENLDNRTIASKCYRKALKLDVHCYEAFEALTQNHSLTAKEEQQLLNSLPMSQQCKSQVDLIILKNLYKTSLKKYHSQQPEQENTAYITGLTQTMSSKQNTIDEDYEEPIPICYSIFPNSAKQMEDRLFETPEQLSYTQSSPRSRRKASSRASKNQDTKKSKDRSLNEAIVKKIDKCLSKSLDVQISIAERFYYNCYYTECLQMTESILKIDPFHHKCILIHVACLVYLQLSTKLFSLAHRLVDIYPNLAIAWYAVGCYYLVIKKFDSAIIYFQKAITLDQLFGPAWLMYGHAYALESEHDHAMATYFKATQLMKGCHLPILYLALENGVTSNENMAEKFFMQAKTMAPDDPFVLHEIGVVAFQNAKYESAERYFKKALSKIKSVCGLNIIETWEPILNNLGHTCRKRKKYEEALEYHKKALSILPNKASTYAAIAYCQALMGQTEQAVEGFHKALGLRPNDSFCNTMINFVVPELLENDKPFQFAPDEVPKMDFPDDSEQELVEVSSMTKSEQKKSANNGDNNLNVTDLQDVSMSF